MCATCFTPHTIPSASLSICEYFFSVEPRVLDANSIGFSDPSGIVWDKTAPNPLGDATGAKVTGHNASILDPMSSFAFVQESDHSHS